jgi:hypothetical protein
MAKCFSWAFAFADLNRAGGGSAFHFLYQPWAGFI